MSFLSPRRRVRATAPTSAGLTVPTRIARRWRARRGPAARPGTPTSAPARVNARDRIGDGPWHNAKGELVANTVDELHSDANKLTKQTALTEKGGP